MKKRKNKISLILLLSLTLFFIIPFNKTNAESVNSSDYGGNGSVGFYGEYEFPDEGPLEPPTGNTEVPSPGNTKPNITKPLGSLPQTGENQKLSLIFVFIGVFIIGLILIIYKNRKEQ